MAQGSASISWFTFLDRLSIGVLKTFTKIWIISVLQKKKKNIRKRVAGTHPSAPAAPSELVNRGFMNLSNDQVFCFLAKLLLRNASTLRLCVGTAWFWWRMSWVAQTKWLLLAIIIIGNNNYSHFCCRIVSNARLPRLQDDPSWLRLPAIANNTKSTKQFCFKILL